MTDPFGQTITDGAELRLTHENTTECHRMTDADIRALNQLTGAYIASKGGK